MLNQKGFSSKTPINIDSINFSKEVSPNTSQFIAELEVKEAEDRIWKSQVIIMCPNSTHAYLGPIPNDKDDNEALDAVFPCYEKHAPLVFTKGPYNLNFMKSKFRIEPKHEKNEDYLRWLNKVERKRVNQLSREGPKYHNEMLIAALYFWNISTNSLHLKCGMLTPTLLDVAAITGLKPIGETFHPDN